MKKLAEHPVAIVIGLVSSIIGVFVFVTGISDLRIFFKKQTQDSSLVQPVKKDSSTGLEVPNPVEPIDTTFLTDLAQKNQQNADPPADTPADLYTLQATYPDDLLIQTTQPVEGKDMVVIRANLQMGKDIQPIAWVRLSRQTYRTDRDRLSFIAGYSNGYLMTNGERVDNYVYKITSDGFQPVHMKGRQFQKAVRQIRFDDGMIMTEELLTGFVKDHFVSMSMMYVSSDEALADQRKKALDFIESFTFNNE